MYQTIVLKDSINFLNQRVTTIQTKIPRIMLPEITRHRKMSFSVESSRAKSLKKTLREVSENHFTPFWTGSNIGMQGIELSNKEKEICTIAWEQFLKGKHSKIKVKEYEIDYFQDGIIQFCEFLEKRGIHKQNVNRLIEPFQWIDMIITSNEWNNFFDLRLPKDLTPSLQFPAQNEIQNVALSIHNALNNSTPIYLNENELHLPYVDDDIKDRLKKEKINIPQEYKEIYYSGFRIATISFGNHLNETTSLDKMIVKGLNLQRSKHFSPFESTLKCPTEDDIKKGYLNCVWEKEDNKYVMKKGKYFSNTDGWIQGRKILENK